MASRARRPQSSSTLVAALIASGAALLALVVLTRFGLFALAGVAMLGVGLVLLDRPGVLFGLILSIDIVCQYRAEGLLGFTGPFFEPILFISPLEGMTLLLVGATFLDARRRHLRMPEPFTLPLILGGLALVAGIVVGVASGGDQGDIRSTVRPVLLLLVTPFVVANVVHGRAELRRALAGGAALTILMAVLGLVALGIGAGQGSFEGSATTYYLPTPVWLMLLYLLGVVAALVMRVRLPRWVLWGTPLVATSLALSYQRAFWIGTAVGLVVVLFIATGPVGRPLLIPTAAVAGLAVWAALSAGIVKELHGPLGDRVKSLRPAKVLTNAQDRYRIGERRNVLADLEEHPITGLGMGVDWTARYGLSVEHRNGRQYTHIVALWWWLKMGLFGLAAYLWLMGAAIFSAYRQRVAAPDPLMRVAGAAVVGGLVALLVIETTASYTGVDPSFSVLLGSVLGVVAAARAELSPARARARAGRRVGMAEV